MLRQCVIARPDLTPNSARRLLKTRQQQGRKSNCSSSNPSRSDELSNSSVASPVDSNTETRFLGRVSRRRPCCGFAQLSKRAIPFGELVTLALPLSIGFH